MVAPSKIDAPQEPVDTGLLQKQEGVKAISKISSG
jgi:hypothetical protein